MAMRVIAIILGAATLASSMEPMELTKETWDGAVAGKKVFLMFYDQSCVHCHEVAPAWDLLTADYQDSEAILVAAVDCSAGGRSLCAQVGIDSYPTFKYKNGDEDELKEYEIHRKPTYKQLKAFVNRQFGCGPSSPETCTGNQKALLDQLMSMDREDLSARFKFAKKTKSIDLALISKVIKHKDSQDPEVEL